MRKQISLLIDPSVHEAGKVLAKADRRSFSLEIEQLIENEAKRRAAAERDQNKTTGLPLDQSHAA